MDILDESKTIEEELPASWTYSEVPEWRDAVAEYLTADERGYEAAISVFDTDFDKYWVRLDPGEPGRATEGRHVEEDELFYEVVSLAVDYNVRKFMEGLH